MGLVEIITSVQRRWRWSLGEEPTFEKSGVGCRKPDCSVRGVQLFLGNAIMWSIVGFPLMLIGHLDRFNSYFWNGSFDAADFLFCS